MSEVVTCQWWALCGREAEFRMPHPVLGEVPICGSCKAKVERLADDQGSAATWLTLLAPLLAIAGVVAIVLVLSSALGVTRAEMCDQRPTLCTTPTPSPAPQP